MTENISMNDVDDLRAELEHMRAERDAALARAEKAEALNKTLELNAAEIDRSRYRVMAELEKLERDALKSHAYVWAGSNPFTGEQVLQLLNENDALTARGAELQAVCDAARAALEALGTGNCPIENCEGCKWEVRFAIRELSAALAALASGAVVEGEVTK